MKWVRTRKERTALSVSRERWNDGETEKGPGSGQAGANACRKRAEVWKKTPWTITGWSTPCIPGSNNGISLWGQGESSMSMNGVRVIPLLVHG